MQWRSPHGPGTPNYTSCFDSTRAWHPKLHQLIWFYTGLAPQITPVAMIPHGPGTPNYTSYDSTLAWHPILQHMLWFHNGLAPHITAFVMISQWPGTPYYSICYDFTMAWHPILQHLLWFHNDLAPHITAFVMIPQWPGTPYYSVCHDSTQAWHPILHHLSWFPNDLAPQITRLVMIVEMSLTLVNPVTQTKKNVKESRNIAQNDFYPIMFLHISCVGLCVHGFMNPMPSWFVCIFVLVFFLRCFNILCYGSGYSWHHMAIHDITWLFMTSHS